MRHAHLLIFSIWFLVAPGCESAAGSETDPIDSNQNEGTAENSAKPQNVGLPVAAAGADCESPYPLDFATWVHGADAILVGDVVAVHLNDDVVYSGETPVDFSDCEPENVSAGLRIQLSDVESVASGTMRAPTEVFVGESVASSWVPQPYYAAGTSAIEWAGQGAVIGPGLKLGIAAFHDPDLNVWYGADYSFFEVEPSGSVLFQSNPCVETPAQLQNTTVTRLRDAISSVSQPTSADLSEYRNRFAPADATARARYYVATHCLLENRDPDPVTPDPEADAL